MFGGNDYKINEDYKHIKNATIRDNLWGVVSDNILYLNGYQIVGVPHLY